MLTVKRYTTWFTGAYLGAVFHNKLIAIKTRSHNIILLLLGDGSVDFIPDYLMEVSSPDFDLNTAKEWFELEDTDGDGFVSKEELLTIAEKVGMSKEEAEQSVLGYYMSVDRNNDSKLSWKGNTYSLYSVISKKTSK